MNTKVFYPLLAFCILCGFILLTITLISSPSPLPVDALTKLFLK